MDEGRVAQLEQLGMVWRLADERFQENLEAAKAYYDQHWTHCAPPTATALDRPVGQWLSNLRRPGALEGHPEWETALKEIDEYWNPAWPADWQRHYAAVRELLRDEEGQADVIPGVTCHGMDVGKWLAKQRQHTIWTGLTDAQREVLEQLGIVPLPPGRKPPPRLRGGFWGLRARGCGPRSIHGARGQCGACQSLSH
ncbi:helicase associated domain-containing protein [Streptomyces chartreusis]